MRVTVLGFVVAYVSWLPLHIHHVPHSSPIHKICPLRTFPESSSVPRPLIICSILHRSPECTLHVVFPMNMQSALTSSPLLLHSLLSSYHAYSLIIYLSSFTQFRSLALCISPPLKTCLSLTASSLVTAPMCSYSLFKTRKGLDSLWMCCGYQNREVTNHSSV